MQFFNLPLKLDQDCCKDNREKVEICWNIIQMFFILKNSQKFRFDKSDTSVCREDVKNLTLGYPSSTNRNLLGEIYKVNPEILGYPRIPGSRGAQLGGAAGALAPPIILDFTK